ncbi:aspartyl/glutamyl-tRNA amidotransferase subunit A [Spiroplasma syrphidicola EA-1]|uniref:Aspartyl/glutamyl-tRNA amidotransferase subunit A n=1 Tax=Spiroplasma syrphidicola EA-1 TaxID=1276229 RepID=R4UMN0_9MOLU|nr:amidase family protein [Spiroplasma syrphidicola]AGM26511.1 aspartyl/glutamyl-tRNA amidotransferase subunit A [Spiroplasma syrphidicola EA-1]
MKNYTVKELHEKLVAKEITPSAVIKDSIAKLKKYQVLNATVTELETIATNFAAQLDNSPILPGDFLAAIPYVAKDNFATKGILTTASSKILSNFVPTYESTVTELLKKEQAILVAKTALDELGMGGHGLYAYTGDVLNPWDLIRITGGSSSGSAALVASGVVPFALGTDTGDSVRKPASYCGIVGFKPSYGLISRFGVIPYAPSLDTVGYFTRSVVDSAIILDYLAKNDHQDATSLASSEKDYYQNLTTDLKGKKFAYFPFVHKQLSPELKTAFNELFVKLREQGVEICEATFPEQLLKTLLPVYMIISYAEAISTHSALDGINFGLRVPGETYEDVMINSRVSGFGRVVKRRYAIGSYALSKDNQTLLFLKAKRVRRLIVDELTKVFANYDILLLPSATTVAPKISDVKAHTLTEEDLEFYFDDLLVLANMMGNPSITVPLTLVDGLPVGVNINAKPFADQIVLNASLLIEEITGLKNLVAPGGEDNE